MDASPQPANAPVELLALENRRLLLACWTHAGVTLQDENCNALRETAAGFRLVIIDPLVMFHSLREIDNSDMDTLARDVILQIAHSKKQGIILVAHASQHAIVNQRSDHHAGRGGTAFSRSCPRRMDAHRHSRREAKQYDLLKKFGEAEGENQQRGWKKLTTGKGTHAPTGRDVWLQHDDGGLLYRPPYAPGETADAVQPSIAQPKRLTKVDQYGLRPVR